MILNINENVKGTMVFWVLTMVLFSLSQSTEYRPGEEMYNKNRQIFSSKLEGSRRLLDVEMQNQRRYLAELNFEKVSDQKECNGSESSKDRLATIEECASACKNISSMFIYGINNGSRCNSAGCMCFCETSANSDGSCIQVGHSDYNLYKYKAANSDCTGAVSLEVTPDRLSYGRPGTFFSNRPWSRFINDRSEPYQPYHHIEIKAVVRDIHGNGVEGCTVKWETGLGAANGWIFPVDYVINTNEDGEVFFYWGAGTYADQAVTVYFEKEDGDRVEKVITGRSGGERCLGAATYYGWDGVEDEWVGFKTDIKIVTSPGRWFYSVFLYNGMYTGIKTGGGVIFSMWSGNKMSEVLWPEENSPELRPMEEGGTHWRSFNPNSVEGEHVGTGYDPKFLLGDNWWLGKTWGFELELVHFPNMESVEHTDATVWFTDYENDTRTMVGKIRFFGNAMAKNTGNIRGFKEHVSDDQMNCLKVNRQHVVYSNSAYRKASDPNKWDTSPLVKPNSAGFQFAKMFQREADGAHFSSGGMGIGYPIAIGRQTAREIGVSCFDGVKNGLEYDVDCGGTCAPCTEPTLLEQCFDGIENGKEKGVDCGGGCPRKCFESDNPYNMIVVHSDVNREHLGYKDGRGMTWDEAKEICESKGKILALIDTEEQNLLGQELCKSTPASGQAKCWMGLVRNPECRTPSCHRWEGTDIWHDQTVFNHFGNINGPEYQSNQAVTFLRNSMFGEWAINDGIHDSIHLGASGVLCTDVPTTYPKQGMMTDEIFIIPSNPDEVLRIAKSRFYYDTECQTTHIHNDIGKTDFENSKFDTFEDHFQHCAEDGGVCVCDGMVRFGLYHQKWNYQEVSGSIACGGEGGFHTFPHMPLEHKRTCQCLKKESGFTMKTMDDDFWDTGLSNGSTRGNADGTNTDGVLRWKLKFERPVGCVRLWDFEQKEIPASKFIVTDKRGENNVCVVSNPCGSHGVCNSVNNKQVCSCSVGWEGEFCNEKILQACIGAPSDVLVELSEGAIIDCDNLTEHGEDCRVIPWVTWECDATVYCDNGDYVLEGSCEEIKKSGSECAAFGGVVVNNMCYYENDDLMKYNYADAVAYCKSQDSEIASVYNQEIYDAIDGEVVIKDGTYIGATSDGNGNWEWANGKPFWKPSLNDGLSGITEMNIMMSKNGKWHDVFANGKKKVLCEIAVGPAGSGGSSGGSGGSSGGSGGSSGGSGGSSTELNFEKVSDQKECNGSESSKDRLATIEECASACKNVSSMFIYGIDNGNATSRCNSAGCMCYCETSANSDGSCTQVGHSGYNLYKYKEAGNDGSGGSSGGDSSGNSNTGLTATCSNVDGFIADGRCMFLGTGADYNYEEAKSFCSGKQGEILSFSGTNTSGNQLVYQAVLDNIAHHSYLGGISDGSGNWSWEDEGTWQFLPSQSNGNPFTDGLNGTSETKLVFKKDGRWDDWGTGSSKLGVVCELNLDNSNTSNTVQEFKDKCDSVNGFVFGTDCFFAGTDSLNYSDSQDFCLSKHNGSIAVLSSEAKYNAVLDNVINHTSYIGATTVGDGDWQWNNGDEWSFVPGTTDGLNGTTETRLAMKANGVWNDWGTGSAQLRVICQFN